jgi:hypothetical protein
LDEDARFQDPVVTSYPWSTAEDALPTEVRQQLVSFHTEGVSRLDHFYRGVPGVSVPDEDEGRAIVIRPGAGSAGVDIAEHERFAVASIHPIHIQAEDLVAAGGSSVWEHL